MNLTIDQGNSRTKVALFNDEGRIVKNFIYKSFAASDIERLFALYPITDSIISSVVNIEPAVVNTLNRLSKHFVLFDYLTPIPIRNGYSSPETLGQDRLAAAVGAATLCPDTNVLIIDAGSAITYDFVAEGNEFVGGNIAPGIKMRLTMLNRMTKKLPLVEVEENELIPLFGKTTRDAIAIGVIRGVVYEVKGYIRSLMHSLNQDTITILLTGGNAPYIANHLNSFEEGRYKLNLQKHLVLIGLNRILEYNKQ